MLRFILDIVVGGYLLCGAISGIVVSELPLDSYIFIKWFCLASLYLLVRVVPEIYKYSVLFSIIGVGVVQSIIAIAQQLGYAESNHSMFPITGFLGNPGQLGGFQAVAFVLSVATAIHIKKIRYYIVPITILIGYSVVIADSRAGWLAVIVGLSTLYGSAITGYIRRHKIILIPIIVATIASIAIIYNYRSDSADSRLLIWRVCAEMIADKPIVGHGTGSFNDHYMLYQADYFENNPDSRFVMVADNVAYPYNELLHVWIEQGMIGAILLIILIAIALNRATPTIKAGLTTLLIFSMFSYPSYVWELLILFPILIALSERKPLINYTNIWLYICGISPLILSAYLLYNEHDFYKTSRFHITQLNKDSKGKSTAHVDSNFERIMHYPLLNSLYALSFSTKLDLATDAQISKIIPSCENWCDIGLMYQNKQEYQKAESYFHKAAQMIPSRFKPKYYLWKLYEETGNREKAEDVAIKLLSQKLKVENTFTLRSKAELRRYLYEN